MKDIKGIVLYSLDYKEKGKIVYLYTKYGIKGIRVNDASSMKSKNLSFSLTLNVVNAICTDSNFPSLKEYDVLYSFYDLASSIEKIEIIQIIIKVLKNIKIESIILNEKYLEFVIDILLKLKEDNSPKYLLLIFLVKSLIMFGVNPNFSSCINCKSPNVVFFSIDEGASYCSNCKKSGSESLFIDLKTIYLSKISELINYKLNLEIDTLLEEVYRYYIIHVNINLNYK